MFDGGDTLGDGGNEVERCLDFDSLLLFALRFELMNKSSGGIRRRTLTSKPGAQKSGVKVIIVKSNEPYTRIEEKCVSVNKIERDGFFQSKSNGKVYIR